MTLYTEGFGRFVTSTTAPIATGWSDSCRVGISPTERTRLPRRTEICGLAMPYVNVKITREGATAQQKAQLIAGVTDLLKDVLNKAPSTTVVVR
jgi:hypothetical protein